MRFAVAGSDILASYDKAGRPVSVTSGGRTLAYQYDAASRRTRMTWPDGFFIAYDHDMLNRMIAVRENGAGSGVGVLATYAYDDLGRRSSILRGNGVVTSYGYDAVSRLASLSHDLAGTSSDYAAGFGHSPASAITMRDQSNGLYDWSAPATGAEAASHNDLDQLTNAGGSAITHDANGNLATWGSWSFAYDIENRLKQISGPTSMTLAYDPLGRLAGTVAGAATTQFLYDGSDLVAEYDGAGNVIRRYVHGPGIDEPLVWYEGSGTAARRWLHADERGSVIAASTATGNPFATWRYGPHGESADTTFSRFGYTGQMTLEGAPLQHFKARAYAPALGRFLQPDPIGQAGGLNLYAYAGNDPVNFRDPFGLLDAPVETPGVTPIPCPPGTDVSGCGRITGIRAGSGGPSLSRSPTVAALSDLPALGGPGGLMPEPEGKPEGKGDEGRMCFQDPPFRVARDILRGINRFGGATVDAGTDLTSLGALAAVEGFFILGPVGAEPGAAAVALGLVATGIGSVTTFASGSALFLLGDRRAGVTAILDALGGRVLRRIPDEVSFGAGPFIENFNNSVIEFLNDHGADIRDCRN